MRVEGRVPRPIAHLFANDARASGVSQSDRLAEILVAFYSSRTPAQEVRLSA